MPAISFSRWAKLSLASLSLLALAGGAYLWWTQRELPQRLELFYGDPQAMFLVPLATTAPLPQPTQPDRWAKAAFEQLQHAPSKELVSLLSSDAKLEEASWSSPTWHLTVRLGQGAGSSSERLLVGSLVRTFVSSFPGAQRVEMHLQGPDGKPWSSQHLDFSEAFTSDDFLNRMDEASVPGLQSTIWWRLPGTRKLAPVQVPLSHGSGSLPLDSFQALIAGPPSQMATFLVSPTPAGFKPSWGQMQDGVARVELGKALPDTPEAALFVEAMVLTLTEQPAVKSVQFLQKGAPMTASVGPFSLDHPIERPEGINALPSPSKPS